MNKTYPYIDDKGRLFNTHVFSEAANTFKKLGTYTKEPFNSKAWVKYWKTEWERCMYGHTVGEITITGYNYFYLNYYTMPVVDAELGVVPGFPRFTLLHYNVFNILDYTEKYKKNLCGIKLRGCGFSELFASISVRDFFIVPRVNASLNPAKNLYFASDADYLFGDGIMSKIDRGIKWVNSNCQTAFYQPLMKNTPNEKLGGFQSKDRSESTQTSGHILANVIDKPDKVRGGRGNKILYEEAGAFPNLIQAFTISEGLVKRMGQRSGSIYVWGTSNESDAGIKGLKSMWYNPRAYDFVAFKNPYEKITSSEELDDLPYDYRELIIPDNELDKYDESEIGSLFIPTWDGNLGFTDKHGNPLRKQSYEVEVANREVKRKVSDTDSQSTLALYMADYPFKPSEAFNKIKSSLFNTDRLAQQLSIVKSTPSKEKREFLHWIKDDIGVIKGCRFEANRNGNIVVLEEPQTTNGAKPLDNLYIAGIDGIDMGSGNSATGDKGSKFAMIIKKRMAGSSEFNNTYVAYYLERPFDERDAYDNALKLSLWYNCQINLEYTRKEIIGYFRKPPHLGLPNLEVKFCAEPDKHTDNVVHRTAKRTNQHLIGTRADAKTISYMQSLLKEYIQENSEKIWFEEALKQLLEYSADTRTKFDLAVAMELCELFDRELDFLNINAKPPKEVEEIPFMVWRKDSRGNYVKRFETLN